MLRDEEMARPVHNQRTSKRPHLDPSRSEQSFNKTTHKPPVRSQQERSDTSLTDKALDSTPPQASTDFENKQSKCAIFSMLQYCINPKIANPCAIN